jgi:hypothetical protein
MNQSSMSIINGQLKFDITCRQRFKGTTIGSPNRFSTSWIIRPEEASVMNNVLSTCRVKHGILSDLRREEICGCDEGRLIVRGLNDR